MLRAPRGRWLGGAGVAAAVIALSVGLGQLPGGAAVVPPARPVRVKVIDQ